MLWDYEGCKLLDSEKVDYSQERAAVQDMLNLDSASELTKCPRCSDLETLLQNMLVDPMNAMRAELADHRVILSRMEELILQSYDGQFISAKQREEQGEELSIEDVSAKPGDLKCSDEPSKHDAVITANVIAKNASSIEAEEHSPATWPL